MPQSPEQRAESRRLGGRNSAANRPRYPKGHPKAGQLMPRNASPLDPPTPDPVTTPPADPATPPAAPPADRRPVGGINPLTATPRDLVDRILGRKS